MSTVNDLVVSALASENADLREQVESGRALYHAALAELASVSKELKREREKWARHREGYRAQRTKAQRR